MTSAKLTELKRIRRYLYYAFTAFVLLPIFVGPLPLMMFEAEVNSSLDSYEESLMYNYQIITQTDITNSTVFTTGGKIIIGIFSLFYLVFFGFIASIISITFEIWAVRKGIH